MINYVITRNKIVVNCTNLSNIMSVIVSFPDFRFPLNSNINLGVGSHICEKKIN